MSNLSNQDARRQSIVCKINGLMQNLHRLALHPDSTHNTAPIFLQSNPYFKSISEHDSMIGSMMMEAFLGSAFAEVASDIVPDILEDWAQDFDIGNAIECYSEYISDTHESAQKNAAHGQGSFAKMSGRSIAGNFNMNSSKALDKQKFMADMPERLKIEQSLAHYARELENIDASTYEYAA